MASWEDAHLVAAAASIKHRVWAGFPIPIDGERLVLADGHPFRAELEAFYSANESMSEHRCSVAEVNEAETLVNEWISYERGRRIYVIQKLNPDGKRTAEAISCPYVPHADARTAALHTIGCAKVWRPHAEKQAMELLRETVSEHAHHCYVMTGGFLETSERSHVTYWFRRLRPTLAVSKTNGNVLAALCLHPVGYYQRSWAGVMTPTDEVVAHVMLMRGDERRYWAMANQHPPEAWESGG